MSVVAAAAAFSCRRRAMKSPRLVRLTIFAGLDCMLAATDGERAPKFVVVEGDSAKRPPDIDPEPPVTDGVVGVCTDAWVGKLCAGGSTICRSGDLDGVVLTGVAGTVGDGGLLVHGGGGGFGDCSGDCFGLSIAWSSPEAVPLFSGADGAASPFRSPTSFISTSSFSSVFGGTMGGDADRVPCDNAGSGGGGIEVAASRVNEGSPFEDAGEVVWRLFFRPVGS